MAIESTAGAEDTGGDGAWPLVVVGAGAAGLLAAVFAARRGARVLLLETRPRPGAKILVSGGGRCNVLPSNVTADEFETSGSPRTVRNLLGTWPRDDVHRFFEAELGVPLAVEAGGKVFPASGSARDVLAALLEHSGVRLEPAARVDRIARGESGAAPFVLEIADGRRVRAARIVLATGGRSLPKTGSDGAGYRFAAALGHDLVPPRPALVPLLDAAGEWGELAGVTLPVALEVRGEGRVLDRREGSFLFTHRGFSGPAVLDVSHHFTAPGGDSQGY